MEQLLRRYVRGIAGFNSGLSYVTGFSLVVIMAMTVANVLARWLFNSPLGWAYEVGPYILIIAIYMSLAFTLQEGGHVRIDLIVRRFRVPTQRRLWLVCLLMAAIFTFLLLWGNVGMSAFNWRMGAKSNTSLGVPMFPIVASVGAGALLLLFGIAAEAIKTVLGWSSAVARSDRDELEQLAPAHIGPVER